MKSSEEGLFSRPAPRVSATLASASFFDVFAAQMVKELNADDPFSLADALILLPNRRAVSGLVDAFAERLGGAALLPTIRPLGDVEDDPDVWGPDPVDLPPAIDPLRRRLELAALIRKRDEAEGGTADPVRALAFADELCRLLDSAAAGAAVDWSRIESLVEEREYAEHWLRSARFLQIIATYWPQRLAADGLLDPVDRRSRMLLALAALWEETPPHTPVVIAGSTGSVLATRILMQTVARLPRGAILLPGLDVDLDEEAWAQITPQHPQFALKQSLQALGVSRADVGLIGASRGAAGEARRILIREALVPADATADWPARLARAGGAALAALGVEGLTLYEAESEEAEASIASLLLRHALEAGESAALVTPDANLARRVESKLARWGVAPLMSLSRRLETTPHGLLLALLARLALDEAEPVSLAALLRHPLAAFGMNAPERAARLAFERVFLRGPRRHADLANVLSNAPESCRLLASALCETLAPLRPHDGATLSQFAGAVADAAERVAGVQTPRREQLLWSGIDGVAAARFLQRLIEHGAELGPLTAWEASRAFVHALSEQEVSPERIGDPRVAILGLLEARLIRRDLVILGGLNEGVWPAPPPEDMFLSRPMREALGLAPAETRIGLAAHDFEQLASAPRVALTRALRRDGAPTIASRWLWRLKTLLRAAGGDALLDPPTENAVVWTQTLDAPRTSVRLEPVKPRPPAAARLSRLSVTEVETLVRDPYAVYARRILGLRQLESIGAAPGASHRGRAIHKAVEQFVGGDAEGLISRIDDELAHAGFSAIQRTFDRARLAKACTVFAAWVAGREHQGAVVHREIEGSLLLPGGQLLTARADRVEFIGGWVDIVDYKTGAAPSDKEVTVGLAPQLPLEGALLARGAFKNAPSANPAQLIYWRFGGAEPGARIVKLESPAADAAESALAALIELLARYGDESQAFFSKPRAQFARPYADYDLLARRKEWVDAGDAP